MANPEHLAILKQGVKAWNEWRERKRRVKPDLSNAEMYVEDFRGIDFHNVNMKSIQLADSDLTSANLRKANMEDAYLYGCIFRRADLSRAILTNANLRNTNLVNAKMQNLEASGADFYEADLSGARLTSANLPRADFLWAKCRNTDFTRANLMTAAFGRTDLRNANLTQARIWGASVWGVNLREAKQSSLVITLQDEPTITVDNLEVAQFIYLLLDNERIRQVIDTITSKVVLILGRFTPERKAVLDAIREELRKRDYLPVLFDFDKPANRDITETMRTLALMSRFVIADITNPRSIPQELLAVVETTPSVPIQPILRYGSRPWGMYEHIKRYPWVLPIHKYRNKDGLLASLVQKIIAPAEAKAVEWAKR